MARDEVAGGLRHARASLELRPFDAEYEATLRRLLRMEKVTACNPL